MSEHEKPGIFITIQIHQIASKVNKAKIYGKRNSNEVDDTWRFKEEEISPDGNQKQTMAMTRRMSSPRNLVQRCQAPSMSPSNRILLLLRSTKRKRTQSRVCNSSQSSVSVL